jgi:hypothetical protein
MQEKHLFEYAIIRLVPKVEREEFLNVGVILYCGILHFLDVKYFLDPEKVMAIDNQTNLKEVKEHLDSFFHICKGGKEGGPIGQLNLPERFRWLTATRSTIIQTSKVHPGFCEYPDAMLDQLFLEMVK